MKAAPDFAKAILVALVYLGSANRGLAGDPPPPAAPPHPTPGNPLDVLNDRGISFPVTYTGEGIGNVSGGHSRGAIYEGLLTAGVRIDLEKFIHWNGATFYASAVYPHGQSPTARLVHDFNGVSSIDANHDLRLYEAWIQQDFAGGKFSVRAGQLLADAEFFGCDDSAFFVNGSFSTLPSFSKNFNAPAYPTGAPGVRIYYAPNRSFYMRNGIFAGNAGNPFTDNRHGTRFFDGNDGALFLSEAGYTFNPPPNPDGDPKGKAPSARPLSGTYKIGGFYNSSDTHTVNGAGRRSGDRGVYFIADQELWHEPGDPKQGLRCFAHLGEAPSDRNIVAFYTDGGLDYQGLVPSRDADILALGLSFTKVSRDAVDATGLPVAAHHETVLELTYLAPINDHLSIQPDFQYIFNPGATIRQPNAVVAGLRFNLTF